MQGWETAKTPWDMPSQGQSDTVATKELIKEEPSFHDWMIKPSNTGQPLFLLSLKKLDWFSV